MNKNKKFSGSVKVRVEIGMEARIKLSEKEGEHYKGRIFVVDSLPWLIWGVEVVALNNLDGSRFARAYDLSMLEITDLKEKA